METPIQKYLRIVMRDDLIIRGNDDKIRFGVSCLILIYLLIQQYGKQDVEKKKKLGIILILFSFLKGLWTS